MEKTLKYEINHTYWHGGEYHACGQLFIGSKADVDAGQFILSATDTGISECFDEKGTIRFDADATRQEIEQEFQRTVNAVLSFH